MANKTQEREGGLAQVLAAIEAAVNPGAIDTPAAAVRVSGLLGQLRALPGDEKKKLREKDQTLKRVLAAIVAAIQRADHMPQGTARILLAIVHALALVEEILEEIKKLHGIPPGPPVSPPPPVPPPPVPTIDV